MPVRCFFAFSNEQLTEGLKKFNLKKEDIRNGGMGLYGTVEGMKKIMSFYDEQSKRIGEECDPQIVYDYEFGNHECGYTHDDTKAIKLVVSYFGEEKAKLVKRHNGCSVSKIEDLSWK
jgi:hypothetical protein